MLVCEYCGEVIYLPDFYKDDDKNNICKFCGSKLESVSYKNYLYRCSRKGLIQLIWNKRKEIMDYLAWEHYYPEKFTSHWEFKYKILQKFDKEHKEILYKVKFYDASTFGYFRVAFYNENINVHYKYEENKNNLENIDDNIWNKIKYCFKRILNEEKNELDEISSSISNNFDYKDLRKLDGITSLLNSLDKVEDKKESLFKKIKGSLYTYFILYEIFAVFILVIGIGNIFW